MPAGATTATDLKSNENDGVINHHLCAENFWMTIKESIRFRVINPTNTPIQVTGFKYCPKRSQVGYETDAFVLEAIPPCANSGNTWGNLQNWVYWLYDAPIGIYNPDLPTAYGTSVPATDPVLSLLSENGTTSHGHNNWEPFKVLRQLGAFRQRFPPWYTAMIFRGFRWLGGEGATLTSEVMTDLWTASQKDSKSTIPSNIDPSGLSSAITQMQSAADSVYGDGKTTDIKNYMYRPIAVGSAESATSADWSLQTAYSEKNNYYIRRYFKIRSLGSVTIPVGGAALFSVSGKKFRFNPIRDNGLDFTGTKGNANADTYWSSANITTGVPAAPYGMCYPTCNYSSLGVGSFPALMGPGWPSRTCPVSFRIKGMYGWDADVKLDTFRPQLNVGGAAAIVEEVYTARYNVSCKRPRIRHRTEVNMLAETRTPAVGLAPGGGGAYTAYTQRYPAYNPIDVTTDVGINTTP